MNYTKYIEYIGSVAKPMSLTESLNLYRFKLIGELGELVDKYAKQVYHGFEYEDSVFLDEAGDLLWYGMNLSHVFYPVDYLAGLCLSIDTKPSIFNGDLVHGLIDCTYNLYKKAEKLSYVTSWFESLHAVCTENWNTNLSDLMEINHSKLQTRLPRGKYEEQSFKENR